MADLPPTGGSGVPPSGGSDLPPTGGSDLPPSGGSVLPPTGGSGVDEPRPGELTPGWAVAFGLGWLAVAVALAGVWAASRQLGLSTWWLGPRSNPRPIVVSLLPFVAPVLLMAAAVNRVRYLPWLGLAGAATIAATGLADLGRVRGFGLVELLIAAAAAAVSVSAVAGMYRRDRSR